jgi:phospholipase C
LVDSDHPASGSTSGPDWVASIVNAIGTSSFWESTAIVFWDDWGGWYDHVPPPQVGPGGLGFRTPALVISPYAKRGYVSHVQYETGSVDRLIEGVFRLKTLAAADARANDLDDCFDFAQAPRAFSSFALRHSVLELLRRAPSRLPPDTE